MTFSRVCFILVASSLRNRSEDVIRCSDESIQTVTTITTYLGRVYKSRYIGFKKTPLFPYGLKQALSRSGYALKIGRDPMLGMIHEDALQVPA